MNKISKRELVLGIVLWSVALVFHKSRVTLTKIKEKIPSIKPKNDEREPQ